MTKRIRKKAIRRGRRHPLYREAVLEGLRLATRSFCRAGAGLVSATATCGRSFDLLAVDLERFSEAYAVEGYYR